MWAGLLLAIAACLTSAPAGAQDIITVTADRRGEPRDAAIIPVAVIDAVEIELVGAQHVSELLNRSAGANINRGNGAEHLTAIRSPVLTGGAGAGSFLYLEDGVPLRAAGFANVNGLFEALTGLAAGVELVRGPGSALHGSNALHGLVNILTPDPATTTTRAGFELGSFGRVRTSGVLARPGADVSAVLAVEAQHEDGWREAAGLDRVGVLARADGTAGDVRWQWSAGIVTLNQETAGYVTGGAAYEARTLSRANANPEAFRDAVAVRMALRLDGEWGSRWSWSLTPYARGNEMDLLMHFLPSQALEESGHTSVGLLASTARDFAGGRITIGSDYEHTSGYLRETQSRPSIFSFVQGDHYDYDVDAHVLAVYAQGRWQVNESLAMQAGLRAEQTRFAYVNHLAADTIGRFLRLGDRIDSFETLTPHAGAIWRLDADRSLFGRIARGARAPQTTELYRLQAGQEIDGTEPETLDSIEAGYRQNLGGDGRLELTAFSMAKRHVFFRDADGFNVTDGRTRHHGIEAELDYPLAPAWRISLAGTWARHSYDFDRPVGTVSEVIRVGADIDTAPRWLWDARLVWQPHAAWSGELQWSHTGAYYTDAANAHRYDGHDLLALRLRYAPTGRIEVFTGVRNLLDERYAERADFAFGNERYFPGEPRAITIGIRVTG
ncbi:TonB-dependent receptor [Maricaulis salignorans]|uniref:Outer membrane receptor proteins, mostly Fe transport n=1 Tax=Maricaulis salignorans TaxID=144026 RepID=A0A1G9W2D6_9PROT|nr:TonB-dependent receptor [Maricaulis salignorans]SDM78684.1 Outer membrane receptor proteins, mostly Fe transport [Maricaulis salignorans]